MTPQKITLMINALRAALDLQAYGKVEGKDSFHCSIFMCIAIGIVANENAENAPSYQQARAFLARWVHFMGITQGTSTYCMANIQYLLQNEIQEEKVYEDWWAYQGGGQRYYKGLIKRLEAKLAKRTSV